MFKFAYTNLHEFNLDWILSKVKKFAELIPPMETAVEDVQALQTDVEQAVEDANQALEDAGQALETAEEAKEIAEQAAQGTIADGSVTTAKLDDGAVTTVKIADGAVTGNKIGTATIQTGNLSQGCVTSVQILDGTITDDDLGTGCVTPDKIDSGAVTTAKLDDGAVTTAKLDSGAVTNAKIQDGAVTKVKLGEDALEDVIMPIGTHTLECLGVGYITSSSTDVDLMMLMPRSLWGRTISNVSTTGTSVRTGTGGYVSGYDEEPVSYFYNLGAVLRIRKVKAGGWGVTNNMVLVSLGQVTFTVS